MLFLFVNLITEEAKHMKLTKKQQEKLKKLDIVKATQKARKESDSILNDQGLSLIHI